VDTERLHQAHIVTLLDGTVVSLCRLDEHDAQEVIAFYRELTDRERKYRPFVIRPGLPQVRQQTGRRKSDQLCDRRI
jgi:hypothetical protein